MQSRQKSFNIKCLKFVMQVSVCLCFSFFFFVQVALMNEVINDDYNDDTRLAVSSHISFSFEPLDLLKHTIYILRRFSINFYLKQRFLCILCTRCAMTMHCHFLCLSFFSLEKETNNVTTKSHLVVYVWVSRACNKWRKTIC